jgi:putative inorganic carbon (hco3(-)) transporter
MLALLVAGLAASISLSETMLGVLAGWLLWQRAHGRLRTSWPLAMPILAFAAWTVVAALLSRTPWDSFVNTRPLLTLATFWIVLHAIEDAPRARWFATALFVALTVIAALAVVQVATCTGERLDAKAAGLPPVLTSFFGKCRRAHAFFSIYMTLGGVLAIVLTLTLPRLPQLRRRAAAVSAWLVGALALALTLVRGAWVGVAFGVAVLAGTVRRQALLFAGVLLLAALVLAVPGVLHRVVTIGDVTDPSVRERLAMWSAGLTLVREHPIAGVGPGQVKQLYGQYAPSFAVRRHTSHLHDTPLQIAVERGLVGLALWLWIFGAFFVRTARIWRTLPAGAVAERALVAGCMAAVAAFLVAGLFEYNFGDTEVLLVALSVMALPFVIERGQVGTP